MSLFIDRTGETRTMKCGLKATIINYRKAIDMDIQFEDGTIVYNRTYSAFKKGEIRHPNINISNTKSAKNHIGEIRMMNCRLKATIINYHNTTDIDIQFEDGTIVYNREYTSFKKGSIKHPNIETKIKTNHIGETRIMNCGLKATIINYRKYNDIDVQFEDRAIAYNKRYIDFKKGVIKHPNIKIKTNRIGETNVMNCGLKATIINYRGCDDIDIQFEDGTIVYNKKYTAFKKGITKHPNIKTTTNHIGETRTMKCGLKATIINHRGYNDIDIQFEDSTIVYNKRYTNFKNGEIRHPNINTSNIKSAKNHIGETRIMKCGLKATIINYRKSIDIDIQFEDGTIVYNRAYNSFKKGEIKNPNIKIETNRIGEIHMMNCRLKATIINYRKYNDIDIKFENGIIVYNKGYANFKNGSIKMPKNINNIKPKEFAYKINNEWYYICSHPTWAEDKILSVKEIYDYH